MALQDFLDVVAEIKAKVIVLQEKAAAGGMTVDEEAALNTALKELSQFADPDVPNPVP